MTFPRPGHCKQRAGHRAHAARPHENTHSQRSRPLRVDARQSERKNALAQQGKNHQVCSQKPQSALDEDGGKQPRIAANVAHAFEDWREVDEISRAQRLGRIRMRLLKTHGFQKRRGAQKGKRVEQEDRVPAQQRGHRPAQR